MKRSFWEALSRPGAEVGRELGALSDEEAGLVLEALAHPLERAGVLAPVELLTDAVGRLFTVYDGELYALRVGRGGDLERRPLLPKELAALEARAEG